MEVKGRRRAVEGRARCRRGGGGRGRRRGSVREGSSTTHSLTLI